MATMPERAVGDPRMHVGATGAGDIAAAHALSRAERWRGSPGGRFPRLDIPGGSGPGAWLGDLDLGPVQVGRVVTMARGAPALPIRPVGSSSIVSRGVCR